MTSSRAFVALSALVLLPGCGSGSPAATHAPAPSPPLSAPAAKVPSPPTPEEFVEELLRQMTFSEKAAFIGGDRDFFIRAIPRLGIPEVKMADGPSGCRNWGPSTAYPAPLGLAAAFDPVLERKVGEAMGRDCRARDVRVLLAPGVNIVRSPRGGRNFEYFGEDPFLAGETAVAFIEGVQSQGVMATVKHFAGNNRETERDTVSSDIEPRALREIYLPAFEAAVKRGHVASVMTGYNLLNGTYCSHNTWLLQDLLKKQWAFDGFVMSDWAAVHDTAAAYAGGCDLEMPSGQFMNEKTLAPLLANGTLDPKELDEKVRRLLRMMERFGLFKKEADAQKPPLDDPTSAAVALEAAEKSLVLLKNEGELLPLAKKDLKKVLVLGPLADPAVTGGSGSAYVTPFRATSLLAGLRAEAPEIEFLYHPGVEQEAAVVALGSESFEGPVREEIFSGTELKGAPLHQREVTKIAVKDRISLPSGELTEKFSVRWTGQIRVKKAGKYRIALNADDGGRVFLGDEMLFADWSDHAPRVSTAERKLKVGTYPIRVEYFQGVGGARAEFGWGPVSAGDGLLQKQEIAELAKGVDLIVLTAGYGQIAATNSVRTSFEGFWPPDWARTHGLVEAEASDRAFALPKAQLATIRLAVASKKKIVFIGFAGGAFELEPFASSLNAILWAFYPGQEGGKAIAGTLFGRVNPSAKLPVTFARSYADYPSSASFDRVVEKRTTYEEGVFVGYRGFEKSGKKPLFSFGHGLSYTRFEYADLRVEKASESSLSVRVRLKNVGTRPGAEVVQVYVAPKAAPVSRPPKELQGFSRVELQPGKEAEVTIELPRRAFAYFDEKVGKFVVAPGEYEVLVARSSERDELRATLALAPPDALVGAL